MTDLRRHVPPLTLSWDQEAPGALWRVVDGTLVFADVSGFTALTERQSRRGRIGAEQIVETLNRVFGPMLLISAARGGELLKFSGDALLFLFRGLDHPQQACDSAAEMRAALRAAAAEPTAVGRISLSMSVGVHSGDIHLFLVGSPSRELLILGPGATATAIAERAANPGQVVVSASTAARLPAGSVRPREDGRLLLRRRSAHTDAGVESPLPPADPALLRTLFPRGLGDHLASGPPDPEHRLACMAFIRFSGTDRMLTMLGPEELARASDRTVGLVSEALEQEGLTLLSTDIDIDGGKFFLGSGIPTAFEDNEGRMLRTLRRMADADSPLPLQFGVNRGHVFAAEVGLDRRAAYTGMGDTTNTAARIAATAPAGAIYAHPAVLEHSRTLFEATAAGPFAMKGKALPLVVYEVGEELGTRDETTADFGLPFLGRDQEIALTLRVLELALDGTGDVLSVVGPTGMGKTRLMREALDRLAPDHLLVIRSEPYGAASPYRAFRDPIRTLLGIRRDSPGAMGRMLVDTLSRLAPGLLPVAPLIADVAAVDVPSTAEVEQLDLQNKPDRLADALASLFQAALPGRLVLVAEEAHWMDAASAYLMERLVLATPGRPWAIVAIRRPVGGGFAPSTGARVELDPLAPDIIERLVIAATAAIPRRPHEISAIVNKAEGNPLYVAEVTRATSGAGLRGEVPESVGAALSAQIDALPPHPRRILRHCSVLGRSFRDEVLREVLAADDLVVTPSDEDSLATFLEPDGATRIRFRTSLLRDAVYEGLAYRLRATMHRIAGETLERISTDLDGDAPMLALHFWRAGDAERTWRYARRAGAEARRTYANVDAAELYEQALEVSRRVPGVTDTDRAEIWSVLGELRELAGLLDGAVEAYRRAATLSVDPVYRAETMARRARVHSRMGRADIAVRVIAAARRMLAGVEDPRTARAGARLDHLMSIARLSQEKPRQGQEWAERAVASARQIEDWPTLIRSLLALDYAEQQLGRPGLGEHTREALAISVRIQDRPQESIARANLGVLAFYAGHWAEAIEWLTTSSQVAVSAGNDFGAAETDLTYAEILIHQGRLDEADEVLHRALRVLRASGIESYAAHALMLQARLALARGDLSGARERADAAVAQYHDLGSAVDALEASLVLAEVETQAGDPSLALQIVEHSWKSARGEADALRAHTELVRARALMAKDRDVEAMDAIERGLHAARDQELPHEEALLLMLRARWRGGPGGTSAEAQGGADQAQADEAAATAILTELGALALM